MSRIVLVRQGSGSPDLLPIEAWDALWRGPVFAAPGEELARRLAEIGREVTAVPAAAPDALRAQHAPVPGPGGKPALRLLAHVHGATLPGVAALAADLATLADEEGEIVFVLPQEHAQEITKAVFERAMETGGSEVEVVIGRAPTGHKLLDLVAVMSRLRGPGGCPWDAEQTHESLAKYLLDETYELLEAIESKDKEHLAEELGDVLLQVVFHAEIGSQEGSFAIDDVADRIATKLVTRHPHVFGDVEVAGAGEVVANWEVIKDHEKGRTSILEGVPEALPALAYAQKLLKRAGRASLPPETGPADVTHEDAEALGESLLAAVAAARAAGVDAEGALRGAARRFRDRLARAEAIAREKGTPLQDLEPSDAAAIWEDAGR